MAAFVVLLVAVWGVGFLWFRGDLSASSGKPEAKSSESPSASAEPSPSGSPSAVPEGSTKAYTGKVTPRDERRPVDLNPAASRPKPIALPPVVDFTMASFNLLGSTHTKPGGHSPRMASGPQRMGGALQILAKHQITVVGFQEFQPDQRNAFRSRARGWQMYPGLSMGRRAGENSVAWRTDTWEMVKPGLIPIPYFNGRIRPMPYVLLRHQETGVQAYFSTFHNPANIGGNQARHRAEATRRQIGLFNQLESGGTPQFVTGDMNERREYFCRVTGATPLVAAAGGSNDGGCRPPARMQIDWIFGSPGAQWTNYVVDRSPQVRRTTDHPVIVASVKVDAIKFENAYNPTAPTG
jgi:Endonuclease/Exonuclease/phosphatase family